MRKHWEYLKYVTIHKWFVFLECKRLGITYRGIVHDFSKFRLSEWIGYVHKFYGNDSSKFAKAWLMHKHRNPHHWQFWTNECTFSDGVVPLEMPKNDVLEMVADWRAMAKARGWGWNATPWYNENKDKMELHPKTRGFVEAILFWEALPRRN